jgi:hypothetical protein
VRQALRQGDTESAQQALSDLEDALGGDPQQRVQRSLDRIARAIDNNELDDARQALRQTHQMLGLTSGGSSTTAAGRAQPGSTGNGTAIDITGPDQPKSSAKSGSGR